MKTIRGMKTDMDCAVELTDEGYTTQLSLEKSLKIADHSPDEFQWGYSCSGEISEFEIKFWLSLVGAKVGPPEQNTIHDYT